MNVSASTFLCITQDTTGLEVCSGSTDLCQQSCEDVFDSAEKNQDAYSGETCDVPEELLCSSPCQNVQYTGLMRSPASFRRGSCDQHESGVSGVNPAVRRRSPVPDMSTIETWIRELRTYWNSGYYYVRNSTIEEIREKLLACGSEAVSALLIALRSSSTGYEYDGICSLLAATGDPRAIEPVLNALRRRRMRIPDRPHHFSGDQILACLMKHIAAGDLHEDLDDIPEDALEYIMSVDVLTVLSLRAMDPSSDADDRLKMFSMLAAASPSRALLVLHGALGDPITRIRNYAREHHRLLCDRAGLPSLPTAKLAAPFHRDSSTHWTHDVDVTAAWIEALFNANAGINAYSSIQEGMQTSGVQGHARANIVSALINGCGSPLSLESTRHVLHAVSDLPVFLTTMLNTIAHGSEKAEVKRALTRIIAAIGKPAIDDLLERSDYRSLKATLSCIEDAIHLEPALKTTLVEQTSLERLLRIGDDGWRKIGTAYDVISLLGDEAVRQLGDIIASHRGWSLVAGSASSTLCHIGTDTAFDVLISSLPHFEPYKRERIMIEALQASHHPAAMEWLAIHASEAHIREDAIRKLKETQDPRAVSYLVRYIPAAYLDEALRQALERMVAIGDDAIPFLRKALHHAQRHHVNGLLRVLGRIGGPDVFAEFKTMVEANSQPDHMELLLEMLGAYGEDAAPIIRGQLHHQEPNVRIAALQALSRIGKHEAVPALIGALDDVDERVCNAAHRFLCSICSSDQTPLKAALSTASSQARRWLFSAIGIIHGPGAFEILESALTDADERSRSIIIGILASYGDDAAAAMAGALKDKSPVVRREAFKRMMLRDNPGSAILDATRDPDPELRRAAAEQLGKYDIPDRRAALEILLGDSAPGVVLQAAETLLKIVEDGVSAIGAVWPRLSIERRRFILSHASPEKAIEIYPARARLVKQAKRIVWQLSQSLEFGRGGVELDSRDGPLAEIFEPGRLSSAKGGNEKPPDYVVLLHDLSVTDDEMRASSDALHYAIPEQLAHMIRDELAMPYLDFDVSDLEHVDSVRADNNALDVLSDRLAFEMGARFCVSNDEGRSLTRRERANVLAKGCAAATRISLRRHETNAALLHPEEIARLAAVVLEISKGRSVDPTVRGDLCAAAEEAVADLTAAVSGTEALKEYKKLIERYRKIFRTSRNAFTEQMK